ncbi:Plasmodium vivax Vir protein, putative [Plasmodium vivax]|uniref:Vir protein, putative n=1 Tax=Plasmodium vivax TaxID=5855 RepID=A0A1G4E8Q2_PLAVI|nr:Plasmodium vivax Vir protein, putative [Plasmodium vivax]
MSLEYPDLSKLASKILYAKWDEGKKISGYESYCYKLSTNREHYEEIDQLCETSEQDDSSPKEENKGAAPTELGLEELGSDALGSELTRRRTEEEGEDKIREDEDYVSPSVITHLGRSSSSQGLSTSIPEGDKLVSGLPPIPDSTNHASSNGTIISASCVGLTGFLFLLYKFTPLRSMLDPRIRKSKKMLKDGVQGSNELQSHDYDFYPPVVDTNKYNISYQSR